MDPTVVLRDSSGYSTVVALRSSSEDTPESESTGSECSECGGRVGRYVNHNCDPKHDWDHKLRRTCREIVAETKKNRHSARRQNKQLRQDIAALTAASQQELAEAQTTDAVLLAEAKKNRRSARRQNKRLLQEVSALAAAVNRLADRIGAMGEAKTDG